MAHTVDAVVVDKNGEIMMMIIPDDDAQLDDPSFNPPGGKQVRVPRLDANPAVAKMAPSVKGAKAATDITTAFVAAAADMGLKIQIADTPKVADEKAG